MVDLSTARALRRSAEVLVTRPIAQHGEVQGFTAIRGKEVLFRVAAEDGGGLVLHDLATSSERRIVSHAVADRGADNVGSDLDGSWVVWMETTSQDYGVQPWVLLAYDRASKRTTELARSPLMHDGEDPPPPPGYTGPILYRGRVYWAQTSGTLGHEWVDVYGCDVARCQPRRLARGAAFPQATAHGLYVVTSNAYRGNRDGKDNYAISRRDPVTGRELSRRRLNLTAGQAPNGFAVHSTTAAATVSDEVEPFIQIIDLDSDAVLRIDAGENGTFSYPVVTARFVLWAEGNSGAATDFGGYLWDLQDEQLYSVGNTAGLYNLGGDGDLVVWQESKTPRARREDISYVVGRLP